MHERDPAGWRRRQPWRQASHRPRRGPGRRSRRHLPTAPTLLDHRSRGSRHVAGRAIVGGCGDAEALTTHRRDHHCRPRRQQAIDQRLGTALKLRKRAQRRMEARRLTSDAEALGGVSNLLLRGRREHNAIRVARSGRVQARIAAQPPRPSKAGAIESALFRCRRSLRWATNVGARRVWLNALSSRHVADVAPRRLALRAGISRF